MPLVFLWLDSLDQVDTIPLAENRATPRNCCTQLTATTTRAAAAGAASSACPPPALPFSLSFSPIPTVVLGARFRRVEARLLRPTLHDNIRQREGGGRYTAGVWGRREMLLPVVALRTRDVDFCLPRVTVSIEEPLGQVRVLRTTRPDWLVLGARQGWIGGSVRFAVNR